MSSDDEPQPHPVVRLLQTVTPSPIRKSFTLKFGLVLALMAVSIGGIGFLATEMVTAQTEQRVTTQFENSTAQKAEVVEEWRGNNKISVRLLSESEAWRTDNESDLTAAATTEREQLSDDVKQIHVIDDTDTEPSVAASTSRIPSQPVTGVNRPYIQNSSRIASLEAEEVYVSDTYEVNDLPLVAFVSPIPDRPDSVLVVEASLETLQDSLSSEGDRRAVIVDEESNTVMVGERSQDTLTTYAESDEATKPIRSAAALRDNDTAAGVIAKMPASEDVVDEPYTVGYAPVPGSDWVALVDAPRSSEFGFVQTVSNWGLIATILAVLLIGVTGTVIGYSTSTAIDRLTGKTEELRDGNLDVEVSTTRVDNIGRLYDGFAEMRDALETQINEAEKARKEAEVSRSEALALSNHLEEQAEVYSEVMQQCASGDLTQRMDGDPEDESMDRIASEFNEMIEELEKTTGQLKSYVDEVETAGAEVEQSARTVRKANEQVAEAVQEIAVDADDQKERLQTLAADIDRVVQRLDETVADEVPEPVVEQLDEIRDIAADVDEIAELSEEMQAATDDISAATEEQTAELTEVSERADDLQRYAQPLRDILGRFETDAEHEFVFSTGPTGAEQPPSED